MNEKGEEESDEVGRKESEIQRRRNEREREINLVGERERRTRNRMGK